MNESSSIPLGKRFGLPIKRGPGEKCAKESEEQGILKEHCRTQVSTSSSRFVKPAAGTSVKVHIVMVVGTASK